MNVRKFKMLRRKSLLGKILRLPFKLIPARAVIPIVSGPLQGQRWIKGSHNFSIVLGTYERIQSSEFGKSASQAQVFWDLGAHVGYYSLLFRASNLQGEIIAFEPSELNAELFKRHMQLNKIGDYSLYTKAVSNQIGSLAFYEGKTSVAGKLTEDGERRVDVIRLSEWVANKKIKIPQLIKMDIEGEEYKVLQDIHSILKTHKPKIFLSTHGKDVHQACISFLGELGYSFKPLDAPDLKNCKEVLAF